MRQSKNKRLAKLKADRYFSEYIRKRDSENGVAKCISCGRITSNFDAGHFIDRSKEATRYDEKNVHAQCVKCNRFESGRQFEHSQAIDAKYGEGTSKKLLQKSKMRCSRTKSDYEFIAKEYKDKLDNL